MAMVMCMNQQINPTLLLDQQVIKAKIPLFNKALFKNGIEESSFIGREVMKGLIRKRSIWQMLRG